MSRLPQTTMNRCLICARFYLSAPKLFFVGEILQNSARKSPIRSMVNWCATDCGTIVRRAQNMRQRNETANVSWRHILIDSHILSFILYLFFSFGNADSTANVCQHGIVRLVWNSFGSVYRCSIKRWGYSHRFIFCVFFVVAVAEPNFIFFATHRMNNFH